jgi:hypothetical protein
VQVEEVEVRLQEMVLVVELAVVEIVANPLQQQVPQQQLIQVVAVAVVLDKLVEMVVLV